MSRIDSNNRNGREVICTQAAEQSAVAAYAYDEFGVFKNFIKRPEPRFYELFSEKRFNPLAHFGLVCVYEYFFAFHNALRDLQKGFKFFNK